MGCVDVHTLWKTPRISETRLRSGTRWCVTMPFSTLWEESAVKSSLYAIRHVDMDQLSIREVYVLWIVSRDFKVSFLCCGCLIFDHISVPLNVQLLKVSMCNFCCYNLRNIFPYKPQ